MLFFLVQNSIIISSQTGSILNYPLTTKMDTRDGWVDFNSDSDSELSSSEDQPVQTKTRVQLPEYLKVFADGKVNTGAEISEMISQSFKEQNIDPSLQTLIKGSFDMLFQMKDDDKIAGMMSQLMKKTLEKTQTQDGKSTEEKARDLLREFIAERSEN